MGFNLTEIFEQPLTLWRTFPGAPGVRVGFSFRLYLSEDYANRREATIGAGAIEKAALMRGFKTGIIADTLTAPPMVVKTLPTHPAQGAGGIPEAQSREETDTLDDFPTASVQDDAPEEARRADMKRRAREFFMRTDAEGNQTLWFLVESLFQEYWEKALPDTFRAPDTVGGAAVALPSKTA